jgi:[ribosomal protein S5]-alanine N-acetyltransferase
MEFKLRPWTMDDLDSLVRYANNINIAKNLNDSFPHPYGIENGKGFIKMATEDPNVKIMAIDVNGEAIGGIGLHVQFGVNKKNAELGYWVAEPFWGNGIISKAIPQMIEIGFASLDINRIFARPFGTNIASQKTLEKNGFVLEGRFEKTFFKLGEYYDELIYAVRKP